MSSMEELDFTYSSRKSLDLLRKLETVNFTWNPGCVTANEISSALFKASNIKPDKLEKADIKLRFWARINRMCKEIVANDGLRTKR